MYSRVSINKYDNSIINNNNDIVSIQCHGDTIIISTFYFTDQNTRAPGVWRDNNLCIENEFHDIVVDS